MMQTGLVRWLLPVAAVLVVGLAATPAQAQIESREGIALRDQIAELRHEVQILQAQISNGGGGSMLGGASRPPPSNSSGGGDVTAQLLVRVDQLDDQVRQLRGRIDELQNQLQQQTADLGKRIDDLAFQMQNPQAAAGAARQTAPSDAAAAPTPSTGVLGTLPGGPPGPIPPGQAPPNYARPTYAPPGTAPPLPRTPELAMQEGNAALARRDYVTAEAAAHEVLSSNRVSPRAYDAMFLLAQAQAGLRQYSQAALSYDDTYNRARRGSHAEDALLGLTYSLIGLGDKTSACQALGRLHAEFPTPRADLREPIAAARQRAGCR
jgi:TolA-binding protein